MTDEYALRVAEKWSQGHVCSLRDGEAKEYHKACAVALREKLAREQNEPLTIEELREMDGKPVFIVVDDLEPLRMWALVEYVAVAHCVVLTNNLGGRSEYYDEGDLAADGLTIYRHKPAENKP